MRLAGLNPPKELTAEQRRNRRESEKRCRVKKRMEDNIMRLGELNPPKEIFYFEGENKSVGKFIKAIQVSNVGDVELYGSKEIIHGAVAKDKDGGFFAIEQVQFLLAKIM